MTQVNDRNKRTIERIYANARPNQYRRTTTRMNSNTGNKQRQRKDQAGKAAEARTRKRENKANRNRANHKGEPSNTTSKNKMLRRHEHTTKNTSQEREDCRKAEEKFTLSKTRTLIDATCTSATHAGYKRRGATSEKNLKTNNLAKRIQ